MSNKSPSQSAFESNLCKRIIPCLDVHNGMTVKGVNFGNLRNIGDPVQLALAYEEQGADELTFLDISASRDDRATLVELVERIAHNLSIPFTVGGGISSLEGVKRLLGSGADKVSINTSAVQRPELITDVARACGSQCCVVAIDARKISQRGTDVATAGDTATADGAKTAGGADSTCGVNTKSGAAAIRGAKTSSSGIATTPDGNTAYGITTVCDEEGSNIPRWEVLIKGGSVTTGLDAFQWAAECVERGAGEILLTSWDKDGTLAGFDIEMVRFFSDRLPVPIIASGGARDAESFIEVFNEGKADAALAASIFHDGIWTVKAIKDELQKAGVAVRL